MPRPRLVLGCAVCLLACSGGPEPPGPLERAPRENQAEPAALAQPSAEADPAAGSAVVDDFADELSRGSDTSAARVGCSKIDFLFVVDNSGSMDREQASLVQSFPGFMQVIGSQLRAKDFHLMVVDTDGPSSLEARLADTAQPTLDERCDARLGAGRRNDSGGRECGILGGTRFMTHDQPDLGGTFDCVARVGTSGNGYEEPIFALLEATSAPLVDAGCNARFLRPDAMLVVTVVTDEDDTLSPGSPQAWHDQLLAAKGGDPESVVVLGLVGDANRAQPLPGGPCAQQDAKGAPILQEFTESFPYGSLGAICARDYAPFFRAAVSVVDQACSRFQPPTIR